MTIACPVCRSQHPTGANLCATCGHDLSASHLLVCPHCATLNASGNRQCRHCGEPLGGAAPSVGAEPPKPAEETTAQPAPPVALQAAARPLPAMPLDPLAEITAPLGLSAAVAVPRRAAPLVPREPGDAERYDAELLAQLAGEPAPLAEGARRLPQAEQAALSRPWRAALHLLVLLAALAPLFLVVDRSWIRPRGEVVALTAAVADLPDGAPVLLVWAYDASYGGELDPLAGALLQDLGRRAAQIDIIAMSPAALGQARQVSALEPAADVALLGYLPGGEAGWRLLAQGAAIALPGAHREHPVASLAQYDLVVLLADGAATVRGWIEQAGAASGVTPYALVPARSEASLLPYQQSGQLRAVLGAGWAAPEYEVCADLAGHALARTSGLAAFAGVIIVVAVAAMLVGPGRPAPRGGRR